MTTNNSQVAITGTKSVSQFLNQENVLKKFSELLGTKAQGFIASVISAVNSNELLKNATSESVYASALMAATLDLPVNQNLGFAYFIPFNNRKTGKQECQFQIGYKGFVQLAQRSGQFKSIYASVIHENQLINANPLDGYEFDFTSPKSGKIIGYAAKFKLLNGFEAVWYMSIEELQAHSQKYSQTAKKNFGLWVDNFEAMATKTVLKLLISKFAPLSIEMQKAITTDQAVIKNADTMEVEYVDNTKETSESFDEENENQRRLEHIKNSTDIEDLQMVEEFLQTDEQKALYKAKEKELLKILK